MPDPELLPPPPPKKNVTTSELLPPPPKKKDYGGGDLGNGGSVFSDPFAFLIKEQPELHPKPQKVSGKTAPQEPTPFVKAVSFDKFLNKTIRINDNEEISIDPRTIPISPVISDNGDMFVYKVSKKISEGKPLNDIEKKFINANKSPILSLSAYDIQSLDDFVTKNDISSAVLPESATALVPSMAGKTVGEASGSPEGRYAQVRALKEKLSENLLFLQKNLVFSPSDDKMKSMKTIMDELSELDNIETKLARQFTIVSDKGATALVSTDESGNSWNRFLGFIKNYGTLPSMLISDKNENVINKVNELPSEFMTGLNYVRFKEPVEFERVSRLLAEGKPISESQVAVLTNYGIDIERQKLKDQYADGKIDEAQYNVQNKELGNKAYENLLGNKEAGRAFFSSNIAEVLDLMNIEQPNITGTYTDYIFGHRWNYTAEEIEDAAKVVARVNNIDTSDARYKDIVKWLQDNEGAMIGKNSIYKAGWTRDLARGIIQPLSGVSKFIEAPFKTDEQQYAEGKSQGNVNITDIPVKRIADGWQGTVGKVLEGTGQLVSQIGLSYALAGGSMALGTAILGRAGTAALAGDIALADMSAGQIVGKTLLGSKDAIATYAMSYASTYDGYKKTAMNYTSDDATATAVAGGMAGLEGITENFLSPLDIARGVGKKIFGNPSFAKEAINIIDGVAVVNKEAAIKNIILKAVKESGNVILSEIGEEEVTQLADFGVNAMLNPNSQSFKDRNLWQEIGETAYQTGLSMVIPALASGVSAYNANNFAKGSLLIAAQNTQRFVDNLKLRLADNEIDQEQYNNFTQLINTAKVVNETLPQKVDGQKLNSNEKADYIFSRVSETVLEKQKEKSKDAAEVNVLNQKIKEQQDFRTKILKNEGTKNAENNGNNQNAEGSQTDNTDNSQNTKVATSAENIKFEDKVRQVYPTLKNATDEEVNSFVTENAMDNPVQVLDKLGEDSFNEVIAKVPTEELQAKLDFLLSTDTENPNVEVLDGIIASREKEYTTPAVPLSEGNSALRDVESTAKALDADKIKQIEDASGIDADVSTLNEGTTPAQFIARMYHLAKANGSNPELVKAVEAALSKPTTNETTPTTGTKGVEGISSNSNEGNSALRDVETKQQIENFGVNKTDVEPVHNVISQVFDGLKKAGLTAEKTVGDWVSIGKGESNPNSLGGIVEEIQKTLPKVEKKEDVKEQAKDESEIPTWIAEFERTKKEKDLVKMEELYNKIKVVQNGVLQGKINDPIVLEKTIKELNEFKKQIEDYAENWKKENQPKVSEVTETDTKKQPINKIEDLQDVGEKIGGAKKDLAQKLSEVTAEDLATKPLSKVFPKPDFKKLVEEGSLSEKGAILLNFLYEKIPAKPRKQYRVANWVKTVDGALQTTRQVLESESTKNLDFTEKILNAVTLSETLKRDYKLYSDTMKGLGFPSNVVNLGGYEIKKFRGKRLDLKTGKRDEFESDIYSIVNGSSIVGDFKTMDDAINGLKTLLNKSEEKTKGTKFDIYQDRKTKEFFIGKKGAIDVVRVMQGFKTLGEARNFLKEKQSDIQGLWDAMKAPKERRMANRPRVGVDWRKGKNVDSKEFADTFGFRGVEFGNWVNNAERQSHVNEAYDALMDLSSVLGVSPKALSLNGELGFAFGARGSGKANAHYEAGKVVINLTKTRGAGSLAHEWWHAMDNYFSRNRGQKESFITQSPRDRIERDGSRNQGVRKEMIDAFKSVMDAIESTKLAERSKVLDRARSDAYWSTNIEMSARSFENYIIEKLGERNQQNDYLANFKETAEWINDTKGDIDALKNYPYPLAEESPIVNEKFQQFFETIKEDESGKLFKDAEAQYRIESGKNIVEAIKDFDGSPRATVALTHEIMHPTVVAIIDGAKEGNEVGAKHTATIVNEFNKANPNSKVTIEDLIKGNDAFKDGTTSKQYRAVQEFIAEAWEKYHHEGAKGFSKAFQEVLDAITEVFRQVYKSLTGTTLTPELRKMFDELLGKENVSEVVKAPEISSKAKNKFSNLREKIKQKQSLKIVSDEAENRHANSKLTEADNPVQEPNVKALESEGENAKNAAQAENVIIKIDSIISAATDVGLRKVSDISTDEKRFQGRDKLNAEKVQEIAENWKDADQDPIHVWTDPKDGKTYVLSGHHRLAAAKQAGREKVKVIDRSKDFTEEQAIRFAKEEANANRTMETAIERANTLRQKRERGDTKDDINKFLDREGKNKNFVNNLSRLNPKGKTIEALRATEKSDDKVTQKEVEKIADWIGEARDRNKNLTDAHENELFDFLMDREGSKRITTKQDFLSKVNSLAGAMDFNANEPLNIARYKHKTEGEKLYDKEAETQKGKISDLQQRINEINDRIKNPNNPQYLNPDSKDYEEIKKNADNKLSELNTELQAESKALLDLYQQKGKFARQGTEQSSLFSTEKNETELPEDYYNDLRDIIKDLKDEHKGITLDEIKEIAKNELGEYYSEPDIEAAYKMTEPQPPKSAPEPPKSAPSRPDKSVLTNIVNAENTPPEVKKKLTAHGLKYDPESHDEALQIARAVIDSLGIDAAVTEARARNFGGAVNTFIQTEALNALYKKEAQAKTAQEKYEAAEKFAEVSIALDEWARLDAAKSYLERYSPEYIEAKQQEKFYQEHLEEIEAEEKAINEWLNSENEIATEAIADINYVNSLISKYETENKGQDKQPATATESKTDKGVSNDASTQKTEKQKRIDDFNKKADKIANDLIDFLTPKSTRGAKTSGMGIADIINGATTAIKAAYAVSQNIKEAVDAGIKYFKDNWNTDELGELPEDALREKLTNDFEVPVEQIAKSVAKEIRDGNISYNDAKEGKSKEFIDELNKELFGSKKFNFDEDAFKEQIRKQKAIGITEEEVVELLSSTKKITKAQRAIISEVFGESAETDKLAADLKEAFNNLAKGEKPKMVLNRLSKSNITKLVDALRETLTYTPVSNKQLSKMADNIVESMDLNQAEDYLNAMINNSVLGLRQVLRAKLIVALGNEGKNELATNLVRDMADEAIQTGRHSQSLVLAYEILGAKANPAIRAEFERERVEVLQQKAAQMTHNYAKAISEQEVEIGKLNEKIHNMTQKSSAMNKIKEVINRLCGLRNKK